MKGKKEICGTLRLRYRRSPQFKWIDRGIVATRIVTDAAIAELVSVLQAGAATELQNFRFHGSGTGSTAETASDTQLETEVETRDTGTQTSTGAGNYRTVATHTYTGAANITEHGVFSQSTGGVMLDRSVFAAVPISTGSQIEFTYDLTITGS